MITADVHDMLHFATCQYVRLRFASLQTLTWNRAAIHGYLGQHQPLDANGYPIMDDPGLIFFEKVCFSLVELLKSNLEFSLSSL